MASVGGSKNGKCEVDSEMGMWMGTQFTDV